MTYNINSSLTLKPKLVAVTDLFCKLFLQSFGIENEKYLTSCNYSYYIETNKKSLMNDNIVIQKSYQGKIKAPKSNFDLPSDHYEIILDEHYQIKFIKFKMCVFLENIDKNNNLQYVSFFNNVLFPDLLNINKDILDIVPFFIKELEIWQGTLDHFSVEGIIRVIDDHLMIDDFKFYCTGIVANKSKFDLHSPTDINKIYQYFSKIIKTKLSTDFNIHAENHKENFPVIKNYLEMMEI